MVPKLSRVAVLVNPTNSAHATVLKNVQAAAQRASVKILPVEARTPQEIENAFSTMSRENAGAVIVVNDSIFVQQRRQIAELATKHRLPSISANREYAEAGGLMSYGSTSPTISGAPQLMWTKFSKAPSRVTCRSSNPRNSNCSSTARPPKRLGLTIPQSLLISADKVIE